METKESNKFLKRFMETNHDPSRPKTFNTIYLCDEKKQLHKTVLEFEHLYRYHFPAENVMRINGSDFVSAFMSSVVGGFCEEFKKSFRNLDLLIFEDVEEISGKNACMETAYIIIDYLLEAHCCIVFASEMLPREMPSLEDRNRTQFEGCPIHNLRDGNE